jgi:hypothetical protein
MGPEAVAQGGVSGAASIVGWWQRVGGVEAITAVAPALLAMAFADDGAIALRTSPVRAVAPCFVVEAAIVSQGSSARMRRDGREEQPSRPEPNR